jgi:hypothetical protein
VLAAGRPDRWLYLISTIPNFSPEEFTSALHALDTFLTALEDAAKLQVWTELNKEILKHERFSDAQWALSPERLVVMRAVADRHRPSDPFFDLKELFDEWEIVPPGQDSELRRHRLAALEELVATGDTDTVLRLGVETRSSYQVTEILSALKVDRNFLERLWLQSFAAAPGASFTLGLAGLHRSFTGAVEAQEWLAAGLQEGLWREPDVALFLLSWPDEEATWFAARRLGSNVEEGFWRHKSPYWLKGSKCLLFRVVLSLIRRGRSLAAMKSALNRLAEIPDRLMLRFLDAIVVELNNAQSAPAAMAAYEMERVFEELDRRPAVADAEVARREFAFLPLLEHSKRPLKLYRILASEPDLYHEFLRMLFRANDEPIVELDKAGQNKARQAYKLISKFHVLPGRNGDDVDAEALSRWIDRVRELGVETNRAEITDQYVGHILAHSMPDPDGGWPHRTVRDQIERLSSDSVERGLQVERFNMRGAHFRAVFDGGSEERELAARYRRDARIATEWPRTAALLTRIAESWDQHAAYEDTAAKQRKMRS